MENLREGITMPDIETSPVANLIIITGMSGAGKSLAVRSLEDLGFFCVDNLPPVLIPKFAELIEQSKGKIAKVALVIDLRGREFLRRLKSRSVTLKTTSPSSAKSCFWMPPIRFSSKDTRRAAAVTRWRRKACRSTGSSWSARCCMSCGCRPPR